MRLPVLWVAEQSAGREFFAAGRALSKLLSAGIPSYIDALCATTYFLSDVELLALCNCAATNVAIFKHDMASGSWTYLRSAIIDAAAPLMLTSIQVNPGAASVRSHFEKLTITVPAPHCPLASSSASPHRSGAVSGGASSESDMQDEGDEDALMRYMETEAMRLLADARAGGDAAHDVPGAVASAKGRPTGSLAAMLPE